MFVADRGARVLIAAFPWAGIALVAFFVDQSIAALAGKTTFANIGVRFLANVKVSEAVAYLFGAGGVGYGLNRERLRQRTIRRLGARVAELEGGLDRARSSSGLTPEGRTRLEDRP